MLRQTYGIQASPQDGASANSYGCVTPSRTLTNFRDAVELAVVMQRILAVINAPSRSQEQLQTLAQRKIELESMDAKFSDVRLDDGSSTAVTQHRLDLYLLWLNCKLVVLREM